MKVIDLSEYRLRREARLIEQKIGEVAQEPNAVGSIRNLKNLLLLWLDLNHHKKAKRAA